MSSFLYPRRKLILTGHVLFPDFVEKSKRGVIMISLETMKRLIKEAEKHSAEALKVVRRIASDRIEDGYPHKNKIIFMARTTVDRLW